MSPLVSDKRDLRDPQAVGTALLAMCKRYPDDTPSCLADELRKVAIPDYNPEPVDYSHVYQSELRKRAAAGDKYALSLLTSGERIDDGGE